MVSASGLRGSAWLLRVNGGSPLQVQGVARLGIEFLGSRFFVELGFSFYWCGVCRWILLPRRRVDGRLCRLSGRVLFFLTSNLLFAVHDLFSRLDSIRSRHLL
ncbi:BnaA02g29120D [Brassica napus]|uniref:(rape) hypothetical protein n=1 Tax=Brassica napus TaxID=3708 RepID=A0A078IK02_BRANA|nr:unnamed protein product [Brassica napus]CDY49759.1 BnaA02g29120D [Brassica napus]